MYKPHNYCRACGLGKPSIPTLKSTTGNATLAADQKLVSVFDLGLQPLANDFQEANASRQGYYPLEVLFCPRCTLAQLSVVVDPATLYSHYSYVTSHSKTMMAHFERIRDDILGDAPCGESVLEVGSNDGTLLAMLKGNPFTTVLGCDPAENLAKIANEKGIPTFCGMFTLENCDCKLPKDVVIARHVMCHIDDWQDFVRSLEKVTHSGSLVFIEVPYVVNQLNACSFDQVYHEHLSYLTIKAMAALLEGSQLHMHRIIHYPIHGGAVGIMLRRNESPIPPHRSVADQLEAENITVDMWKGFDSRAREMIADLRRCVVSLAAEGKTVVGYGASAKSTVWLNACGFTRKHIAFMCDNTPQKMWKLCPGTDIPVVDDGALTRELPNYAINFAWNFMGEIFDKEQYFRNAGGRWIVPVPKLEII